MSTSLGWIVRPTQGSVVTLTLKIEHICMCVGQGAWLVDSLQGFYSAAEGSKTKWPLIPSPTLLSIVWIKTKMWNLWWRCCGTTTVAGGEDRQHRGLRNSLQRRREFEASSVDKFFLESWVMSLERTHLNMCFYQQTAFRQKRKYMQHIHQQRDQKLSHSWEEKYPSSALLKIIKSPALKKCSKVHFFNFRNIVFPQKQEPAGASKPLHRHYINRLIIIYVNSMIFICEWSRCLLK